MESPQLLVIAGCNGAGKSSYSRILSPEGIEAFDYDKHFLEIYSSIIPTDFQDQMAHNMTFQKLETQIDQAIEAGKSFAYETNFNSDPLHWPLIFKAKGYEFYNNQCHEQRGSYNDIPPFYQEFIPVHKCCKWDDFSNFPEYKRFFGVKLFLI